MIGNPIYHQSNVEFQVSAPPQIRYEVVSVSFLQPGRIVLSRRGKPLNFHLMDIKAIQSTSGMTITFHLQDRTTVTLRWSSEGGCEELLSHIRAQMMIHFPNYPQHVVTTLDGSLNGVALLVHPPSRLQNISNFYPHFPDHLGTGPCGSFSRSYVSLCEYFGVEVREEVIWTVDTILSKQQTIKKFDLQDFSDLDGRDLMPLVGALTRNDHFEQWIWNDAKVSNDLTHIFAGILRRNQTLKELQWCHCSLPKDFLAQVLDPLQTNPSSQLSTLNFSGTLMDEKSATSLAAVIPNLPLAHLQLRDCTSSKKSMLIICSALNKKSSITGRSLNSSLGVLDLANNPIGSEGVLALTEFLSKPNTLRHLSLSNCTIPNLEVLFGALQRGSPATLKSLHLDGNRFSSDQMSSYLESWFRSAEALMETNLSNTKLQVSYLEVILRELANNVNIHGYRLILRGNEFGEASLDLSENHFDGDGGLATLFAGLQNHAGLKELQLDKCFSKSSLGGALVKSKSVTVDASITPRLELKSLFTISNLVYLSLAENNLRHGVTEIIPIYSNSSQPPITRLNLRSNNLGDRGAAILARILSISHSLEELAVEENGFTITGWSCIAHSMTRNRSLKSLNIPQTEIASIMKVQPKRAEALLQLIQGNTSAFSGIRHLRSPLAFSPNSMLDLNEDHSLSVYQQEVLQRGIAQLRRQQQAIQQIIPSYQNQAADNAVANTTLMMNLISELAALQESAVKQNLNGFAMQLDQVSSQLSSSSSQVWHSDIKGVIAFLLNEGQSIFGLSKASDLTEVARVRAQLEKLLTLGLNEIMNKEFWRAKIVEDLGSEHRRNSKQNAAQLLAMVKNILFERTSTELYNCSEKLQSQLDEMVQATPLSPTRPRSPTKSRSMITGGIDTSSMTNIKPIESTALEHVAKSRPKPRRTQAASKRKPSNYKVQASSNVQGVVHPATAMEAGHNGGAAGEMVAARSSTKASPRPPPVGARPAPSQKEYPANSSGASLRAAHSKTDPKSNWTRPQDQDDDFFSCTSDRGAKLQSEGQWNDAVSAPLCTRPKDRAWDRLQNQSDDSLSDIPDNSAKHQTGFGGNDTGSPPLLPRTGTSNAIGITFDLPADHDRSQLQDDGQEAQTLTDKPADFKKSLDALLAFPKMGLSSQRPSAAAIVEAEKTVSHDALIQKHQDLDDISSMDSSVLDSTTSSPLAKFNTPESGTQSSPGQLTKKGFAAKFGGMFKKMGSKNSMSSEEQSNDDLLLATTSQPHIISRSIEDTLANVSEELGERDKYPAHADGGVLAMTKEEYPLEEQPVRKEEPKGVPGMRFGVRLPIVNITPRESSGSLQSFEKLSRPDKVDRDIASGSEPSVLMMKDSSSVQHHVSEASERPNQQREATAVEHSPRQFESSPSMPPRPDESALSKLSTAEAEVNVGGKAVAGSMKPTPTPLPRAQDYQAAQGPSAKPGPFLPPKPLVPQEASQSPTKSNPPMLLPKPVSQDAIPPMVLPKPIFEDEVTSTNSMEESLGVPEENRSALTKHDDPVEPSASIGSGVPALPSRPSARPGISLTGAPALPSRPTKSANELTAMSEESQTSFPKLVAPVILAKPSFQSNQASADPPRSPMKAVPPPLQGKPPVPLRAPSNSGSSRSVDDLQWAKAFDAWLETKCQEKGLVLEKRENIREVVKDGISLLLLSEALSGETIKFKRNAMLPVHKIDNLNIFLNYAKDKLNLGSSLGLVTAEDLSKGEDKKILILFEALMRVFP